MKQTAVFLGVLAAALAFGFKYNPRPSTAPSDVFGGLQRVIEKSVAADTKSSAAADTKMALGYNVCVDAILRWHHVIDASSQEAGRVAPRDLDAVRTDQELRDIFAHYFAQGAAAERTCEPALFQQLVERAAVAPGVRRNLGGNAALMARQLAKIGVKDLLVGGHVGPDAAAMLPAGATFAGRVAPADEVHLILEYGKGEAAYGAAAPRANRFILTADVANTDASALLQTIRKADASFGADVLVIAGLHMMEPLPPAARSAALADIAAALRARSSSFAVHLELASSADAGYMRAIAEALFPLVDSVGFNEQEAAFLFGALGGSFGGDAAAAGAGAGADASTAVPGIAARGDIAGHAPAPAAVAALLRFIFERFPSLTRLHFHSLGYHVIAYSGRAAVHGQPGAASVNLTAAAPRRWKASRAAVAAGASTATLEACRLDAGGVSDDLVHFVAPLQLHIADPRSSSAADAGATGSGNANGNGFGFGLGAAAASVITPPTRTTFHLSSSAPVAEWLWESTAGPLRFALAPVAVCNTPLSTVGLGDAISAAGLAYDAMTLADVEAALTAADEASSLENTWPILRVVRRWRERGVRLWAAAKALVRGDE